MTAPTSTTVVCLFVRGEYPYTPEYVTRLYRMVRRWIDRAFTFRVLTDQPELFSSAPFEACSVQRLPGFAYWTKLELFNPDRQEPGRMLYLDLDSLIVARLAPILDAPAPFAITADPERRAVPRTQDSYGRRIVRRFNSSVMVWDGGTHTALYTDWSPDVAQRLSGDQDWIGTRLRHAHALPRAWFPRISECAAASGGTVTYPSDAKVILCKHPKNHIAAEQWPWVEAIWRAA